MANCTSALVVVCLLTACSALQWTNPAPLSDNNNTLEACEGETVSIPWTYTRGPGETVTAIEWYFRHKQGVARCCVDQDGWAGCVDKRLDGCRGVYTPWARAHCQAFCGFCEPCPIEPCRDKLDICEQYGDYPCTAPSMRLWAYNNCMKHCGLCDNYGYYWELHPNATHSTVKQAIAVYSDGAFEQAADFHQTLQFLPNAGITLVNVSLPAFGTYSVKVKVYVNGQQQEFTQEVLLAETELVPTNDSRLHVFLMPEALHDDATGEYHVQLACGYFVDSDFPSFPVIWTTPSGNQLDSTDYRDGLFLLTLPNPVEMGNYSCRLSFASADVGCGRAAPTLREQITVTLDPVRVDLAIMVARVHELEKANIELREENTGLLHMLSGSTVQGSLPRNCKDVQQNQSSSGVYTVYPDSSTPLSVFCDQDTEGGGWTVIQRRVNGSVDFNRNWADYEAGFGDLQVEFWLGLKNINLLTASEQYNLRVELEDWDGSSAFAEYETFYIDGSGDDYRLHVADYSGTAGDSLSASIGNSDRVHTGQPFSAPDRDHDNSPNNCALQTHSGWWFNHCVQSNLNGLYGSAGSSDWHYVVWYSWKQDFRSYKRAEMKIRPRI